MLASISASASCQGLPGHSQDVSGQQATGTCCKWCKWDEFIWAGSGGLSNQPSGTECKMQREKGMESDHPALEGLLVQGARRQNKLREVPGKCIGQSRAAPCGVQQHQHHLGVQQHQHHLGMGSNTMLGPQPRPTESESWSVYQGFQVISSMLRLQ